MGEKVLKLPCQDPHYYHFESDKELCEGILPWLKDNNSCPICREEFPEEEDQGHANHDANTIEKALEWLARTVKREYQDKPDKFDVYQSFKTLMEQVKSEQIELNDFLRRIKLNTPDEIILGLNELLPSGQQIDRKISLQPEPSQHPTDCAWKLPHLALIRLAGNDVVVPVQNQKDLTYSAKNENDDEEMKTYIYYPQPGIDSDLYFTVSTYSHEIIPTSCTTGTLNNGNMVEYPTAYLAVYHGNKMIDLKYYLDQS